MARRDPTTTVAIVALVGAAVYFFVLRKNPQTGLAPIDELFFPRSTPDTLPNNQPGNLSGFGPAPTASRTTAAIGAIGAGSAAVGSILAAGGTTAAAGATAATAATGGGVAATAGGVGLAGTLAITGGIAGAAILTWAVWKKGLFRGGEEALHVNPDRDQFQAQFVPLHRQLIGDSTATRPDTMTAEVIYLFEGEPTRAIWQRLQSADTIDEFVPAAREIQALMARHGIQVQAP